MIYPVFFLAGGRGTRLASVVSDVPKPLAPICGRPFLHYLIENFVDYGFSEFYFLLQYKSEMIIEFLKNQESELLKNCKIYFCVEPVPLGTGGSIAHALKELTYSGEFLVVNADTWTTGNSLKKLARSEGPAIGIINMPNTARYGKISMIDFYITDFLEKDENAGPGWINAGVYKLNSNLFPENFLVSSLEKDLLPRLAQKRILRAVPLESEFIDIGVPEDYLKLNEWIASGRAIKL